VLFLPLSPVDERAQDKHNVLRVDVLDYGSAVSEKGEEVSACILSRSRFVAVSIAISRRRSRDPAYTRRNCQLPYLVVVLETPRTPVGIVLGFVATKHWHDQICALPLKANSAKL